MNKKGSLWDVLVSNIKVLVIFIILLVLVGSIVLWVYQRSEEKKCEFSVWAQEVARKGVVLDWPLDCPAPYDHISSKKDQDIHLKIAAHLKACWQKMGRGEIQVLSQKFYQFGDDSRCVLCSRFTIEKDIDWNDVSAYLESQKIPPDLAQTYSEFVDTSYKREFQVQLNDAGTMTAYPSWADHVGNMFLYWPSERWVNYNNGYAENIMILPRDDLDENQIEYWVMYYRDPDMERGDAARSMAQDIYKLASISEDATRITYEDDETDFQTMYVIDSKAISEIQCGQRYWKPAEETPRYT